MLNIYSYHFINNSQQKLLGNDSNGFCNFAHESGPVNLVLNVILTLKCKKGENNVMQF